MEVSLLRGWEAPDLDPIVERIRRWSEKYDIRVNSVHGPSGAPPHDHWLADPDEDQRRQNLQDRRRVLQAARRIGARYVVVEYECFGQWPFWPHDQPALTRFPKAKELWRQSFENLLEEAARVGIRLAVENVDGLPCADVAEALKPYDPDLVGVCFDSSHASYGPDLFAELAPLIPRLIGTHLSDNDGLEGGNFIDRHWFPFQGRIDWNRLMKILVTATACPVFIVEVLTPEKTITPELVASLDRLHKLIEIHGKS